MRKTISTRRPTTTRVLGVAVAAALLLAASLAAGDARADEGHHADLPPGPIRDRVDLMEGVGKDAKAIGAALKANKPADMVEPANAIAAVMDKFITLFPEGSVGQGSRAKPAVWENRKKFDELAMQLKTEAEAVAKAGKEGGDVKAATSALWKTCKSCHTDFREPMEGE